MDVFCFFVCFLANVNHRPYWKLWTEIVWKITGGIHCSNTVSPGFGTTVQIIAVNKEVNALRHLLLLNTERICLHRVSVDVCSHLCQLGYGGTCISVEWEEPGCNWANQRGVSLCFLQTEGRPISKWHTEQNSSECVCYYINPQNGPGCCKLNNHSVEWVCSLSPDNPNSYILREHCNGCAQFIFMLQTHNRLKEKAE